MKHYFYLLVILFWAACSKEGSSETPVLGPESFQLVYPENGETCLDGVDQDDNEASVLFRWQRSSNASSYSLVIENMSSGQKVTSNSTAPNLSQNLLKSQLYELEIRKQREKQDEIEAGKKKIEWGSQIRNYVLHPYKLVKDLRTNHESSNPNNVLNGDINEFIKEYLIRFG